ncbi:MAG: D-alanine--D-alanine ligase [Actinomycetota bacterium]|nr:D-alanine--D-alanine ligase [Actinomycetota bacterium]
MPELGSVIILAGGLSYEREVSLHSGEQVAEALRSSGIDVQVLDVDADLLSRLVADRPSAVFIALHGAAGEDGAIRDVLDLARVPYVGSTPDACRLAFDKTCAKAVLRRAGIATPRDVALPHAVFRELGANAVLARIVEHLGLPLIVKPARGGSALGVSIVRDAAELPGAMVHCFSYGDVALVEAFVAGAEVAITVLDGPAGPQALPAVEVVPVDGVFDYAARYTAGATEYFTPARLSEDVARRAADIAVQAHSALGLRDLSRTDLIIDEAGAVHVLEVNVAPGLTETSMLPMAVTAAGLDLGGVCRDLLLTAAARR